MAVICVLIAMTSIQVGASLAKGLFAEVGAVGMASLRLIFAAAILLSVRRPWRTRIPARSIRAIACYGCALGAMNLLFYLALVRLPLGLCVAIEFLGPLTVALVSSRRPRDFLWVVLAVAGISLLLPAMPGGSSIDLIGALYALGAAACWAAYIVFGQRIDRTIPTGVTTSWGMLAAALVGAPAGLVKQGLALSRPRILPLAFVVGLLSSALPYSLEMVALKRLHAQTFGIFMSLEPAVAALSGWVLLGEHLTPFQTLAIALVIAASVGSALTPAPAPTAETPVAVPL